MFTNHDLVIFLGSLKSLITTQNVTVSPFGVNIESIPIARVISREIDVTRPPISIRGLVKSKISLL